MAYSDDFIICLDWEVFMFHILAMDDEVSGAVDMMKCFT